MQITNVHLSGVSIFIPITDKYWFSKIGSSGADIPKAIGVSSTNDIFVAGTTTISGTADFVTISYNTQGDLAWQRRLSSSGSDVSDALCVDTFDNLYVAGYSNASTTALVTKYNSSGILQWQKTITNTVITGITSDTTGNIYCTGVLIPETPGNMATLKLNASGDVIWARTLTFSNNGGGGSDVAVDNTGNVFTVGWTYSSGGAGLADIYLSKYSDTGTLDWQRSIGGSQEDTGYSVNTDSSGNAYILGTFRDPANSYFKMFLAKYNTSGTLVWQKILGKSDRNLYAKGMDLKGSHIYIIGYAEDPANQNIVIAKYDLSGNLVWQRTLSTDSVGYGDEGVDVAVDSVGAMCIVAQVNPSSFLIARLPVDGSLTGNYSGYTYAVSAFTDSNPSLTSRTRSATSGTATRTSSTATLTDYVANLVVESTVIIG